MSITFTLLWDHDYGDTSYKPYKPKTLIVQASALTRICLASEGSGPRYKVSAAFAHLGPSCPSAPRTTARPLMEAHLQSFRGNRFLRYPDVVVNCYLSVRILQKRHSRKQKTKALLVELLDVLVEVPNLRDILFISACRIPASPKWDEFFPRKGSVDSLSTAARPCV